jgi:CRISPR-associated protein Csm1
MTCLSSIPSARAGDVLPDVSLYDHLRLTSAFASALYLYHRDTNSIEVDAVKKRDKHKFLLVSGNFYGIQDFIFSGYGDTRKYRSKLLRGRSFYVSLLSEISAYMLCDKIGLPFTSVILNAAGKFTMLAPDTKETAMAVTETKEEINKWLMNISYGEISIGFTELSAAPNDFSPEKFIRLWERLGMLSEETKFSKIDLGKYGGVFSEYLDQFNNRLEHPMCPLCGKRPAVPESKDYLPLDEAGPVCRLCADHIFLGTRLVKKSRIIIGKKEADIWKRSNSLMEPICGRYQLCFTSSEDRNHQTADIKDIVKYWDITNMADSPADLDVSRRFLNGYVPVYDKDDLNDKRLQATRKSDVKKEQMVDEINIGEPKTLSHIAVSALNPLANGKFSGIDALGILKADVDQLGMLMGCGLDEKRFTISRLATLSRQLNFYFALYIPYLLADDERFKNIYTVFAGGDDLFLIGPWNRIYELVIVLQKTFSDYVCNNKDIHFSAGISLKKSHTPIDGMAESAENALEKSKEGRDQITMFFQTVKWDKIENLEMVRKKLKEWLDEELITKSMLYRLNEFVEMAAQANGLLRRKDINFKDMDCLKWRSLFSYFAARNVGRNIKDKEKRKQKTDELIACITKWLEDYEGRLKIPLWNILYNLR